MKHTSHLDYLTNANQGREIVNTVIEQLSKFDAEWG